MNDRKPGLIARFVRPQSVRRVLHPAWFGTLRRTTPLSQHWGSDRGTPVDRHYIRSFLAEHRADIHGSVLEVRDSRYTNDFGSEVTRADVLDIDGANPNATIVADLAAAGCIPSETFDCFILTQTLQFIFDVRTAITHTHRVLRSGGVLLCTVPAVSRINRGYIDSEHWRFTSASCRRLFGECFGADRITVRDYGNVLTGISLLAGIAAEELSSAELATHDEYFPTLVAIRAVKA